MNDPAIWNTARSRLPLPRLMTKMGDGAFTNPKAKCPFCDSGDGKWKVFEKNGRHLFKCHKQGCVANEPPSDIGHGEIGYIALRKNLDAKAASIEYLRLAVPEMLDEQKKSAKKETPDDPPPRSNIIPISGVVEPPAPEKPNPWHALWKKLVLTPQDKAKLKSQRGSSDEGIEKLGFKSNNNSNRTHLESLRQEFSMEILLAEGIFKERNREGKAYPDGPRPNAQLLGWGLSKRSRKEGEEDQWDWTQPILIPYFDENRTVFYLRPHKGGVSRPSDDDDEEETCSSHVYCPFLLSSFGGALDGFVVLCEGEYKADALWECGIPALAIPGTGFVRNKAFRAELIGICRRFALTEMVVCFDNEVKDDPAFPERYKADPLDRWDTQMWAEYIAIDLTREYFSTVRGSVRIGMLPDSLRENGKADFDSALAYFVKKEGDHKRGTDEARLVFKQLIADARPHRQSRELFPKESRRIIECKLERLLYRVLVPWGRDEELRLAAKYQSVGETDLAAAFRSIIGCYYDRERPDRDHRKSLIKKAETADVAVAQAKAAKSPAAEIHRLRVMARAAWEYVKGKPVPISDFVLTCEFKLHTGDGKVVRLVRLRNRRDSGKSDGSLIRLTGAEMARGPEFMRWGYDSGKAVWKGGQRKLSDLCEDMDHHSYYRDIFEVNYYGYHAESKMWFFGDCAFNEQGELIEADANNIFWNAGIGYQVDSSVSERGTTFEQGAPLLLSPHVVKKKDADLAQLFNDVAFDMFATIGGFDAWLMLGLMFGYAAAPELLKRGGHATPWLFGKMSGGKTTIARWIMRIWGFKDLNGVGIDDRTTPVGMNRFLAQYSCLPVWFDEYRSNHNNPQKEAVLRGAFDRNSGAKGLADHSTRTRSARIHTSPIVTGEASSTDAATRSRYGHINVNDKRRIGDGVVRYTKMQSDCSHYYLIGRYLMERRPKFVKEMLDRLDEWMSDDEIRSKILNERVRFVYGTAWSAFITFSRLMSSPATEEVFQERTRMEPDFKVALLSHGEQALQDVTSETFLARFWTDVLSGLQRNKIKKHFFQTRMVTIDKFGKLSMAQTGDKEAKNVCYIAPNAVFDEYAQDLRSRSESPSLELGDLRREMAKEPYWLPSPKSPDGLRVHRIAISGAKTSCWVINLEQEDGKYVFPHGEDLVNILHPDTKDAEEALAEIA